MPKNHIITGLDVGTSSVKGICAVKRNGLPAFDVLGQVQIPTNGMRRGVVVNSDEVSATCYKAIAQLQESSGQRIKEVYTNVGGSRISVGLARGSVSVSRADQKISQEDIDRVVQQTTQIFPLPRNKEILEVLPRQFFVDEESVKEPFDMHGRRLEAEILAVCAFSPHIRKLTEAVLNSGMHIADIIPSPLASAISCLTPQQKETGVALVDIGAGSTGLAVFMEGDLIHAGIFPFGSAHITNDIAFGLKIEIDAAERIKTEFGSCLTKISGKKERVEIAGEKEPLVFPLKHLSKIIEVRVSEMFDVINEEFKKISPKLILPSGVVLTGGGSLLPKISELAKRELKMPSRLGQPRSLTEPEIEGPGIPGFIGLEESPTFSAACGLVAAASENGEGISLISSGINIKQIFKKTARMFFP